MLLKIKERCFSKVVVAAMFDLDTPRLSETERVHLVALLQLLESAYEENIWENLQVVSFQNGGKAKNGCSDRKMMKKLQAVDTSQLE